MATTLQQNHTFLITGASRGLGLALVESYANAGHSVFGCSRGGSDFVHENYHHINADVCDDDAVRNIFKEIGTTGAQVDVLINNAGLSLSRPAILTTTAEAQEIFQVNVLAAFAVMRETIKHMKRTRHGRIINMSSVNVPLGSVGGSIYNASKAALENLGHTLARETARDDITINSIGLSIVSDTGMTDGLNEKALKEKQAAMVKQGTIDAIEIVHVVDFLISDEARNITNQTIYFGGVR
jgi:3-oxoacyl-[acyl-carrier protein] reductase